MTTSEGHKHTLIRFNGALVTTVGRHKEINEMTARGIIRTAQTWKENQ